MSMPFSSYLAPGTNGISTCVSSRRLPRLRWKKTLSNGGSLPETPQQYEIWSFSQHEREIQMRDYELKVSKQDLYESNSKRVAG